MAALKESLEEKAVQLATRDEEIADLKDELADAKSLLERSERELAELRERASAPDTLAARKSMALRKSSSLYEDWEAPPEEGSGEGSSEGSSEGLGACKRNRCGGTGSGTGKAHRLGTRLTALCASFHPRQSRLTHQPCAV